MSSAGEFFVGRPLIFGHRGTATNAPGNTEAAFALAIELGAHALEADIRVTRDGVPVAFHDRRLELQTDGVGLLRRTTFAELAALDAGHNWSPDGGRTFPFRGRGLRILDLDALLRAFPDVRFILHIKTAAAGRAVRRRIDALGVQGRILVAAEWSWRLAAFRNYAGLRGMTTEGGAALLARCLLGLRPKARRALLAPPRRFGIRVLSPRVVACAHAAGQPVVAWVLNRREEIARALEWGVDAIETDRPDVARAALAEWRSRGGSSRPEVIR